MSSNKSEVVHCVSQEEWEFVNNNIPKDFKLNHEISDHDWKTGGVGKSLHEQTWSNIRYYRDIGYEIYSFKEWVIKENLNYNFNFKILGMEELMLDVLNKTYDNVILRRRTVPLFMSNPGIGKSSIIREFAKNKGAKMVKITLSQRMPNEVVGGLMPNHESKSWEVYDNEQLKNLKDGDILFFDEVFNGALKQTLDAVLNLLEDRMLPSGKKLADVMIVAASNPQGLINLTPQIKERFVKYDLTFNPEEYQNLLKNRYGMPESISRHLSLLIQKEKFEGAWDFVTPRSVEKAIMQIGCDLASSYDIVLLPFLSKEIECPVDIESQGIKKGDKVPYLTLLKLIVKNDNKNKKHEGRVTADISN